MSKTFDNKPNTGAAFKVKSGNDKAPDFSGEITLSGEIVAALAAKINNRSPANIRIAMWKRTTKAGDVYLSLLVSEPFVPDRSKGFSKKTEDSDPF
jgi:hypothetical protein